ncbi:unnamed protein product [Cylindrotheca closterium]|uniref:Digalactosyldiacylglycerol synthase n=1 Tax=Cylindrotheca closterium TaxID=2856 RepID=A0AAD2CB96_9STRA|nr:unnamed protein product [Cylindrotheca closterium]
MKRSPLNGLICPCKYIRRLICFALILVANVSAVDEDSESTRSTTTPRKQLDSSQRRERSREQWELAFKEIKAFRVKRVNSTDRNKGFFSQWKLLLDQPRIVELDPETNMTTVKMEKAGSPTAMWKSGTQRFEGFPSWDRILQDWADDVQEYMDRVEAENIEYPMSTHGTPYKQLATNAEQPKVEKQAKVEKPTVIPEPKDPKKKIKLPVPAAARPGEAVLPHTDLSDKSKRIWIVTTAALPWMTGTAVNPLLRAAYMTEGRSEEGGSVTLMIPWLERTKDQEYVYGKDKVFGSPEEQEQYIRTWLREKAKLPRASEELKIDWYTSWQNKIENSLYSMGDITALIPKEEADICILEEPEHLNWYRAPGDSWTTKFKHVVGIIHTNYFVYAQEQPAAFIRAPGMRLLCSWMCRAHCHRVVKLSGTLGQFAPEKELVENVHGVRYSFLESGEAVRDRIEADAINDPVFGAAAEPKVYFIGKMLWSKGLGSLMELLRYAEESAGTKVHVDMYGGGPDKDAAEARAKSLKVDLEFHGPVDHAELAFTHKLFINPSTSEVLCTTVAEALAMGKFVLVPSHPSNDFFAQFPNCLTYANKEEFVGNLYYALTHSPEPLTEEDSYALSWEAATERLEAAAAIPVSEANLMNEALSSKEAGIEITLPPFIEDKTGRKLVVNTLIRTRSRYRQFRSRLSQEIQQSNVLPEKVKERLISDLENRLDLDIDEILESPKLRLQLSPAELDNKLLDLYKNILNGPRGDVLRVLGGGQEVAFQDLYIKRSTSKLRKNQDVDQSSLSFGPFSDSIIEARDAKPNTASQWVQQALAKNLKSDDFATENSKRKTKKPPKGKANMKMCIPNRISNQRFVPLVTSPSQFCPPQSATRSFSLLV